MNLEFSTTFVVMPKDCNYQYPMIFGGAFFSELDLAAACCASRLLHDSVCDSAVTYKVENLEFLSAAVAGDLIFIDCKIASLGKKTIVVDVVANREKRCESGKDLIAKGRFIFATKKDGVFCYHGLKMPEV